MSKNKKIKPIKKKNNNSPYKPVKKAQAQIIKKPMPFKKKNKKMAHAGLEPATFALLARRSNQLS